MDAAELFKTAIALLTRRTIYYGCYPYRVSKQEGDKLRLISASTEPGLPDQILIPKSHGMAGASEQCAPGSTVLVKFQGGNPGAPIVSDYLDGKPITITIDAQTLITLGGAGAVPLAQAGATYTNLATLALTINALITKTASLPGPPVPAISLPLPTIATTKVKGE